ncbi:MAG TPA: hypothetical protein VFV34_20555 [Blastocatellia bacterium]|nr:hypothetical protein [Blastocatellia bacterium]
MKRSWVVWFVVLSISSLASISVGQSGRKIPKRESPPPAVQPPADEAPAQPAPGPQKPKLSIVVTYGVFSIAGSEDYYARAAANGCLERLNQAYVKAVPAKEMNRKEASDLAKQSDSGYVTWLELGTSSTQGPQYGNLDPQNLYVEYILYSPGTGKGKISGRVYLSQAARTGNVGIGLPIPTNGNSADYLCNRVGREIAERVLSALGIAIPPN